MAWNIHGIFSIGNIKPVNSSVGSIIPVIEISMAVCWALVTFEISNPKAKQVIIKRMLSAKSSARLPLISTLSKYADRTRIIIKFIIYIS